MIHDSDRHIESAPLHPRKLTHQANRVPDPVSVGIQEERPKQIEVLSRGTSAHQQLREFEREREAGASVEESLRAVVDMLIANTAKGL